ncbi:GCN5-related N-acetyltransferase [Methanosalsum zhilinae DSM 4017]|uniref:GCN5-related N-acetyltransferase n=1 Tax=Methanosalsum zhilinae (strain DSM 4017 / NBRC 107636 / OCM 62 / WeN5) TaxID=679901 RepID=F7XMC2_METZD|nr:GNAT family N-acetyltransferase [Methanosalsum zhilinae]AEH61586.1 GCN5-related N-acetyltransferase [Methanosalsum zhilinae DSM 4017]
MDDSYEISVVPLEKSHIPATCEVFLSTFADEAFTKHIYNLTSPGAKRALTKALSYRLNSYIDVSHPVFIAMADNEIIGFAVASAVSTELPFKRSVSQAPLLLMHLLQLLKYVKFRNMYSIFKLARKPDNLHGPYIFLEAIGVLPFYQGRGVGGELLNSLICHGSSLNKCKGIYLFTGDYLNTKIYSRYGFNIIDKKSCPLFTAYHMFKELNFQETDI